MRSRWWRSKRWGTEVVLGGVGFAMAVSLVGCAAPIVEKVVSAEALLKQAGFEAVPLDGGVPVRVWVRSRGAAPGPWHIYLEGDGAAWQRGGVPSPNPTPQTPVALWLALDDEAQHVAYLARPCQFISPLPPVCRPHLWTQDRYGEQVQVWWRQAIEAVAADEPVRLVGFSGGAHLALQLAPELPNTEGVVSVAGNLHDAQFARHHRLPAPEHVPPQAPDLPLWSLSGGRDRVVPPELTAHMLEARAGECQFHQIVAGAEHTGPWQLAWPSIEAFWASC